MLSLIRDSDNWSTMLTLLSSSPGEISLQYTVIVPTGSMVHMALIMPSWLLNTEYFIHPITSNYSVLQLHVLKKKAIRPGTYNSSGKSHWSADCTVLVINKWQKKTKEIALSHWQRVSKASACWTFQWSIANSKWSPVCDADGLVAAHSAAALFGQPITFVL